jgi:isopentenyldiphosphate isomerase
MSEMVDLIGADGAVVGVVTRSEMRRRNLRHRGTFVVVRDRHGAVLVHTRAGHKDIWPSLDDICVGGVVTSGEDWDDAARRELAEEIGVVVGPGALRFLGEGAYADADVDVVGRVWEVVHDGPFRFSDGEVVAAGFVPWPELVAALTDQPGRFVPDSRVIAWPLLAPP